MELIEKTNYLYKKTHIPAVSVITTVYNRRDVLLRAMKSVDCQIFRNIEYIVVDNGSSINIDDVVYNFMDSATIPVLYIKRTHGIGPHTGKNTAIQAARGDYLVMLDSDDELLPNAIEVLYNTWKSIPEGKRTTYREVVALCEDENGTRIGGLFPPCLNSSSKRAASKIWHQKEFSVEHVNMSVTAQLKSYPFPEPEGVTWVVDSIVLWDRLSKLYRSYFINDCLKRYYVGSIDSISNSQIKKITFQHCINMLFAYKFWLNHLDEYDFSFNQYIKRLLHYCIFYNILLLEKHLPEYDWFKQKVNGVINQIWIGLLWIPSILGAKYFIKNKMSI